MKNLLLLLHSLLVASCIQAQSPDIPVPASGYLYKIQPGTPGKEIYVCGERPFTTNGDLAAGDLDGQARQVFENIKTSLATVSMTFKDVAQITYVIKGTSAKVSTDTASILNTIGALYVTPMPKLIDLKSTPAIVRDDVLIEIEVIAIK